MTVSQHISHSVFQENTYILIKNDQALIIDPGDDPDYYVPYFSGKQAAVQAVLATHGHIDHIISAAALCRQYNCPFVMSGLDKDIVDHLSMSCERFGMPYSGTPAIDMDIAGVHELVLGDFRITVLHTPGHTPGGVCYLIDQHLFSGDTLFRRSVGRTDLPGGDHAILIRSVRETLYQLPNDMIVYPGHMESTTIGEEKIHNPFVIL